jgi:photosystem II stability/assembly factor-like uncharacterized protein
VNTGLPNTVIRSILTYEYEASKKEANGQESVILVGTDEGIYHSCDQGRNWEELHSTDAPNSLAGRSVFSLFRQRLGESDYILAGTDAGIFGCSLLLEKDKKFKRVDLQAAPGGNRRKI